MKRRLLGLGLAVCLVAALGSYALADSVINSNGGNTQTTLTITRAATPIKVTLPTSVPFTLQTDLPTSGATDSQVVSAETIAITNQSEVPVYTYISKVEQSGVSLVQPDALATPAADGNTTEGRRAAIAILGEGVGYSFEQTNWTLIPGANQMYFMGLEANLGRIEAGGTLNLQIVGRAGADAGWDLEYDAGDNPTNDKFTIKTFFTVRAVKPQLAAGGNEG